MNKYIKDENIINATEKAYNIIYKGKGYKPYREEKKTAKKKEEADK